MLLDRVTKIEKYGEVSVYWVMTANITKQQRDGLLKRFVC